MSLPAIRTRVEQICSLPYLGPVRKLGKSHTWYALRVLRGNMLVNLWQSNPAHPLEFSMRHFAARRPTRETTSPVDWSSSRDSPMDRLPAYDRLSLISKIEGALEVGRVRKLKGKPGTADI